MSAFLTPQIFLYVIACASLWVCVCVGERMKKGQCLHTCAFISVCVFLGFFFVSMSTPVCLCICACVSAYVFCARIRVYFCALSSLVCSSVYLPV